MAINRRQFIATSVASCLLLKANTVFANVDGNKLLSCRTDENGKHFFSMIDGKGNLAMDIQIPARGHGITVNTKQMLAAVFARRPGKFVWVIDLVNKNVIAKINAKQGRHFYGHGQFTNDGAKLLCTENAYETGEGLIGIYDTRNDYNRIGEMKTYGIGPHEFRLFQDKTLVVANGGIRTHPDMPRVKSNLDTMRPNLAYISLDRGDLLHKHEPETKWHQLSIRHIDVADNGLVAIAMQFQGKPFKQPPLIAIQQGDKPMQFLSAPAGVQSRLKNYCGSVVFNEDGKKFAVTSPRGGLVTFWSDEGEYLSAHQQIDACGISRVSGQIDEYYVSDGLGSIMLAHPRKSLGVQYSFKGSKWDNHMVSLGNS